MKWSALWSRQIQIFPSFNQMLVFFPYSPYKCQKSRPVVRISSSFRSIIPDFGILNSLAMQSHFSVSRFSHYALRNSIIGSIHRIVERSIWLRLVYFTTSIWSLLFISVRFSVKRFRESPNDGTEHKIATDVSCNLQFVITIKFSMDRCLE